MEGRPGATREITEVAEQQGRQGSAVTTKQSAGEGSSQFIEWGPAV
jgi:hypothetical protein